MKEIYIHEKDIPESMETCNIEFEPFGAGYSNVQFKSLQEHDKDKDQRIADLKSKLTENERESNARYKAWQEEIRECDRLRVVLADVRKQLAESEKKLNQYLYKNDVIEKQYEELKNGIMFRIENNITSYME